MITAWQTRDPDVSPGEWAGKHSWEKKTDESLSGANPGLCSRGCSWVQVSCRAKQGPPQPNTDLGPAPCLCQTRPTECPALLPHLQLTGHSALVGRTSHMHLLLDGRTKDHGEAVDGPTPLTGPLSFHTNFFFFSKKPATEKWHLDAIKTELAFGTQGGAGKS